uniref:Uncharacterized protein n=1 Tax=Arundo donax TaxID=35708 RepID=A0A0A9DQV1_ARUDO
MDTITLFHLVHHDWTTELLYLDMICISSSLAYLYCLEHIMTIFAIFTFLQLHNRMYIFHGHNRLTLWQERI